MKNKKAFTLIELLAIIIILAIVALIATPIILNVVEDAKKSSSQSEANIISDSIIKYCEKERLGFGLETKICTDSETLKQNIDKIVNIGKVDKDSIKPTVEDGKLTHLTLNSNGYDYILNNGKMESPNLIETLLKQYKPENTVGLLKDGKTDRYYYKGTKEEVANNFLWYGGHQWRVLEFDTNTKTLKLITQQPLTTIQPAQAVWTDDTTTYDSTYINKWLNEEYPNNEHDGVFYNNLREDVQKNIVNTIFNIGTSPNISDLTVNKKVGLLDETQYTNAGGANSYLDIKDWWWLQNRASSSDVRCVKGIGHLGNGGPSGSFGVRVVITISDITIHEGDGTLKQNYKVSEKVNNTSLVQVGDYIKVQYSGADNACGNDNKCMFRVVSKDNDSIKVVLNGLLPTASKYGDTITITTSHTIYTPLNNFASGINDEYQYTTNKKFNIGIYDKGKSYESLSGETIDANVGLPVIGEMFSGNDIDVNTDPKTFVDTDLIENPTASDWYWTMNRYSSFSVSLVNNNYGNLSGGNPSSTYGVRAVIFLKAGQTSNLPFTAGDGSPSSPYELK